MRHAVDPQALAPASSVAGLLRNALGPNLLAVYIHGSAVLGGYDREVSDLDVLVVCARRLADPDADAICAGIRHLELPARGLEMSVLTRLEASQPELPRPRYQLHVAMDRSGLARRVDGRSGSGDRDLVLHLAVIRQAGFALAGPDPDQLVAALPREVVLQAALDEIAWARRAASPDYLVLAAARARFLARTGRLASKLEAGQADGDVGVVRAALAHREGRGPETDPALASDYAEDVETEVRLAML
jgi:streptomycin 3"-adenylyltransferase